MGRQDRAYGDVRRRRQAVNRRRRLIERGLSVLLVVAALLVLVTARYPSRASDFLDMPAQAARESGDLSPVGARPEPEEDSPDEPAVQPPEKAVALTFDDGPGPYTDDLLDLLAERGIPATFFVLGANVEQYPELLARMAGEGHEIGVHTYSHSDLTTLSDGQVLEEIHTTAGLIFEHGGVTPALLRPPGGCADWRVQDLCAGEGLSVVLWSVDTRDWESRDPRAVVDRAFDANSGIGSGDIVLLHDIYQSTVEAAAEIIDRLLEEGYTFLTVSALLDCGGESPRPGEKVFRLGGG